MLKLLYPIPNASGLGDYKVKGVVAGSPSTLEGGLVGFIDTETSAAGQPDYVAGVKARRAVIEIKPTPSATDLPTVGLIDDSTTGAGYGTPFGSYYGTQQMSTSTMAGSKKATLQVFPGVYMTNIFDTATLSTAALLSVVTPGTALYSMTSTAKLTVGVLGTQVGNFIEVVRLRDLYKVSPDFLNNGTFGSTSDTFIVLKFK